MTEGHPPQTTTTILILDYYGGEPMERGKVLLRIFFL